MLKVTYAPEMCIQTGFCLSSHPQRRAVMWVVVQDNDGFHRHNAKEDRTFIFVAGAEQFVDRNKLRHRQSKMGTGQINIFCQEPV